MRKLLLATVAAFGASMGMASYADAQIVDNTDGQAYPTPGTVTVRLNGRLRVYGFVDDTGPFRSVNSGNAAGTAGTLNQGINKIANYGIEEYARLYPGFDGQAANGLKYGASLEIRQDNAFGAGGGIDGSITGNDRTRGLLYFRRTFGYIGTDRLGTIRLGATDQPTSLYFTGNMENFDDGGLNGDLPGLLPNGGAFVWPFSDVGNMYATNKIVYLSPQFFGVDFGVSFEPSTASIGTAGNSAGCAGPGPLGNALITTSGPGYASPGCDALSSTSTGDYTRRRNLFEGLVRYRGTFGPVGIAATASYDGSGRVQDSGTVGSATNPKRKKLEDLSFGDFGLALTFGGLTVGGNWQVGRYTVQSGGGPGGLLTQGQPNSNAFVAGASYSIGPIIFGFHVVESWYQGNQTAATNLSGTSTGLGTAFAPGSITGGHRRDAGIAAGATYTLAPGVALYASYIYEEARQRGVNLLTGAVTAGTPLANAATTNVHNKVTESVFALGTSFAW